MTLALFAALLAALTVAAAWWLLPIPVARTLLALERWHCGMKSRWLTLGPIRWHYLEAGRGQTLVMIHGFNADAHHFTRLTRRVRQSCRVLAPDLPGFGLTETVTPLEYDVESQARRLLEWLDAMGVDRCQLGGSSMGGYVAVALARMAPERIESLFLLAPGGLQEPPFAEVFEAVAAGLHNPLVVRNRSDFERLIDLCFVRRPWMPRPVRHYLAERAAAGQDRAEAIFHQLRFDSPPLEELARDLPTPALILWGALDRVLHPSGLERLAALLPESESRLLENCGHLPMLEHPGPCSEAWRNFRPHRQASRHSL
ncbi:alpha/beta hydrolase [Wenzhouxiangella sp. AB-CW3]|uniref:alpha/beta fold hydrolase n=1 Tax=Wenzhouxiangella sp. AB-CW3 TaxID=2771012 RepID=UPI00168AD65F|nr:alpha/beta hydrolase [Wenzhouxiangella sp. AB-CW3]QOC21727.1 alpha/beta hydrolase [Wenzhouxiangella sp. AB-CW3]